MPEETAIDISQQLLYVVLLKEEHVEAVKELIAKGADIHVRNSNACTPLHLAALAGHAGIARVLLESGADIYAEADKRMTPFHIAAAHGQIDIMKLLLTLDKTILHAQNIIGTALHLAVRYGHVEAIRVLLENGLDIEAKTLENETSLHIAISNDLYEITKTLLEHGANIDDFVLHCAVKGNYPNAMRALLEDQRVKNKINEFNEEGDIPLHLAAYHGWIEVMEVLLQHKADPNIKSRKKELTPLLCAILGTSGYVFDVMSNSPGKTDGIYLDPINGYIIRTLDGKFKPAIPNTIYLDLHEDHYAVISSDHRNVYTGDFLGENIHISNLEYSLEDPRLLQDILKVLLKRGHILTHNRALAVEILLDYDAVMDDTVIKFAGFTDDAKVLEILQNAKDPIINKIKKCITQCLTAIYKDVPHIEIIKTLIAQYKVSAKKIKRKSIYEVKINYRSQLECLSAYILFKKENFGIAILFKENSITFNLGEEKIDALSRVFSLFDTKDHALISERIAISHAKLLSAFETAQVKANGYQWSDVSFSQEKYTIKVSYCLSYEPMKTFIILLKKTNLLHSGNGDIITVTYPYDVLLDDTVCEKKCAQLSKKIETLKEEEQKKTSIQPTLNEKRVSPEEFERKKVVEERKEEISLERINGKRKYKPKRSEHNRQEKKGLHASEKPSNTSKALAVVTKNLHSNTREVKTETLVHTNATVTTIGVKKPPAQKEPISLGVEVAPDMSHFLDDGAMKTVRAKDKMKEKKSAPSSAKQKKETDPHLKHLLRQYEDKDERIYNGKFIIRAIYYRVIQEIILELIKNNTEKSTRNLFSKLRVALVHYFCMDIHWDGIEEASSPIQKKKQTSLLELAKIICNHENINGIANKIIEQTPTIEWRPEIYLALMNAELACLKSAFKPFKDDHYLFDLSKNLCQIYSCVTSVCIIVECFNRLCELLPRLYNANSRMPIKVLVRCRNEIRNPAMHECEDGSINFSTPQEMLESYISTANIHTLILELIELEEFSLKQQSNLSTTITHFSPPPKNPLKSGPSEEPNENRKNYSGTDTSQKLSQRRPQL